MLSKISKSKRLAAGVVGIALALSVALPAGAAALTQSQVDAIIALLQSFGADSATIANVQASLTGSAPVVPSTPSGSYTFTQNLTIGSTGADVTALQQILVSKGHLVMPTGVSTGYFGSLTKAAVIKLQTAEGISPAAGYVGPITRAKLNSMGGPVVGPVIPTGGSLSVAAGIQPVQQIAPGGATRVPFTRFTLTAGSADVVVNSVTVQRVGPGQDGAFAGVVLIDENGAQIGIAKTLNSLHQANIGEPFTVKAGTTRTLTVAGNLVALATIASTYAGEVPAFSVVAINTSVPVVGSLPITGTGQVTNGTLTLGTVTMTESYDPGLQNKPIGTANYKFATIKASVSGEDVRLYSIRWNQAGSASSADVANVITEIDGIKYPTIMSADGKYYTTTFGSGIVIAKGFSKEISIIADIIGGPGRTIDFELYRTTDLYASGETYGYGITPTTSTGFTASNPWYNGSIVTIQAGSITTVGKATEVASTNIAVNVPNQLLGGFATQFVGEPVTIAGLTVYIATSSAALGSAAQVTNVTIVDSNGAVVAGPVDSSTATSTLSVAFTDSITFPTSRAVYTIKGKLPTTAVNGAVLTLSTSPASWTTPTGLNTGNSITISQGGFNMNSMTVKSATTSITVSSQPVSQNIVAGGQNVLFMNLQLDASASGEDIRMTSIPLVQTGTIADITGCQLYDTSVSGWGILGVGAINTGSNVPTTLSTSGTDTTFTFDAPLTITKGTVKTLALKCNVGTAASGNYVWSIDVADTFAATGITSGTSIVPTVTSASSGTMTAQSGSLALSVSASSPSYAIAAGGTSGITAGVLKFRATNEEIILNKIGLKLTNLASSSSSDLNTVSIYDFSKPVGSQLVGTAQFTGTNTIATSTLDIPVTLPKDTDKELTVKVHLADIGQSQSGVEGHLIAVDPDSAEGSGQSSGGTIASGATAGVAGIRAFNTFPTVVLDTLASTGVMGDGKLMRFKVTANSSGDVGLYQFTLKIATTTGVSVNDVGVYAFTNSEYSSPVSNQGANGLIGSAQSIINPADVATAFEIAATTNQITVPAGQSLYFEVRATVSGVDTGDSVSTTLVGDAAYPVANALLTYCSHSVGTGGVACNGVTMAGISSTTLNAFVASTTAIDADTNDNFIWSPNATTTAAFTANDWTNAYSLFESNGLTKSRN